MRADIRRKVASSRGARLAALPLRISTVARHDARVIASSVRWLARSREHTNLTYDLEPLNVNHLVWFVSEISGASVTQVRRYVDEIDRDTELRLHIADRTSASQRTGLADRDVRYGRRIGWYAFVRALRPSHVVETGTDKGLGSCVLAAALLRNGHGQLTTIDVNPDAGYLIGGRYEEVISVRIGDSLRELPTLPPAGLFIHDSWHSREHEDSEIRRVRLTEDGVVLSDNAHVTDALAEWAEETDRRFLYFHERPQHHWYPGSGIGVAWCRGRSVVPGRRPSEPPSGPTV